MFEKIADVRNLFIRAIYSYYSFNIGRNEKVANNCTKI